MRRKLRRMSVIAGAIALALSTLSGHVGHAADGKKQPVVQQQDGPMYRMDNGTLQMEFDSASGLAQVTDKRTGQRWNQNYMTPPEGVDAVQDPTFLDPTKWANQNGTYVDLNGVRAAKFDLSTLYGSKTGLLGMRLPAAPCAITDYDVVFKYKLENVKSAVVNGRLHFERGKNTWLAQKNFSMFTVNDPNGVTTDWQELRIPISAADFPSQANGFLLHFYISGGSSQLQQGSLYVSEVHFVTKKSSLKPVTLENVRFARDSLAFELNTPDRVAQNQPALTGTLSFDEKDPATIKYELGGLAPDSPFTSQLAYPAAFHSGSDDLNWVIPKDSGLLLPSMDLTNAVNRSYTGGEFYQYMGPNMAFVGATNLGRGDGYLMLVDTPISASLGYSLSDIGGNTGYQPAVQFFGDKGKWMENREVRFRFVESGGYVGIAKAYQKVAKEKGYYVTLKEKEKGNPNVRAAAGAHRIDPHIHYDDAIALLDKLKKAGIKNVMFKATALRGADNQILGYDDPQFKDFYTTAVKKYGYTVFNYENYRDLFMKGGEFPVDPDYVNLAQDYRVIRKDGSFLTGWVDQQGNAAYVLNPFFMKIGFDYRLTKYNLKDYPFFSRQFDTLGTTGLGEGDDYNPAHPSDRYTTFQQRQEIMKYTTEDLKLAAHTEGAQEYMVPYTVSFEGSLGMMGVPAAKETDRIPLWELVYHGTSSIYYHWEHGQLNNPNKDYEDLFAMLYGETGMFLPYYKYPDPALIDDMISRIKKLNTVLDRVIDDQMTDFRFLTADRLVQQSVFESGLEVVVNFSKDAPYTYKGHTIQPNGYLVYDSRNGKEVDVKH